MAVGSLVDKTNPSTTDVNSAAVQHQLAVTCPKAVKKYAGGSGNTFELSLLAAIWFIPTPAQIAAGAHWYRCELVVVAGPNKLAALKGRMRNVLAPSNALDRWGTCGTAAPSSTSFQRQLCSARHSWRAVDTIAIPSTSTYLAKSTSSTASKECRAIAARASHGALKYSWSFEWPNKQQWQAGQRYGLCWLPTS